MSRACANGHRDCVEVLQQFGCDPMLANKDGRTARDFAVARKQSDLYELCWNMELMLVHRPSREDLVDRGVLQGTSGARWAGVRVWSAHAVQGPIVVLVVAVVDTTVAPSISRQTNELFKLKRKAELAKRLTVRPDRETLVQRHIIPQGTWFACPPLVAFG